MAVFITGATGFIAQHIIKLLLEKHYEVIGTVRNKVKGEFLVKNFGSGFTYEIVPDIQTEGAFDEALKKHPEITVVLHTASPVTHVVDDPEKDMLLPAVNGTANILQAVITFAPQVKRVVYTSSYAAIKSDKDELDPTSIKDETSWNTATWELAIQNPRFAYSTSKTFAEKKSWELAENSGFKLTTVNPTFVFGPQVFDASVTPELNFSNEILNKVLKAKDEKDIRQFVGAYVDVRDVALAHILAFEKDEAIGQRLLVSNGRVTTQFVLDIINENFPELKGKIPVGKPGTGQELIDLHNNIENSKTREILGFPFICLEESVVDTIKQILEFKNKA